MENFILRRNPQRGYGVHTKKSWNKGEKVFCYEGRIVPTYIASVNDSMTLNAHFSYEWNKGSFYSYVNHSCDPNCYIDLSSGIPTMVSLKDISEDEEITYNYNTVEVDLTKDFASFPCYCGSRNCVGTVRGFLYLTLSQEKAILEICTPFIKNVQAEYEKNRV